MPGLDEVAYLTNSTMMDVDFLPQHLVVVGGSYIGLEFAQMYRRFGSEVTVDRDGAAADRRARTRTSPRRSREILEARRHRRCAWARTCIDARQARRRTSPSSLDCEAGDATRSSARICCSPSGRRPNTDDLGLDKAGVATDERGYIEVDDQLRTNVPGIWALGDCNGRGAFTHTAYNDFEIVAANLLDGEPRRVSDRIPAYALYIDPPLGRVGLTEAEVRRSGQPALVGKRPMEDVGRAVEKGETQGFMKIVVDAETKQILGAAILGIGGDEVIHCILDVMYAKAPYTVDAAGHAHPPDRVGADPDHAR